MSRGRYHLRVLRAAGFTLVELMVTIAIAAILATLAIPAFNEAMLGSRLNSMTNSFIASAQLARSEAIKRNAPVTLCASSTGNGCSGTWADGWVVLAGGAPIHSQGPLPQNFQFSGAAGPIVFQSNGMIAACTALTLENTQYSSKTKTMAVHVTGRASTKDSCS